ncbi:MAG: DUF4177 domain-containing protein [Pseudomonadota bacterium]
MDRYEYKVIPAPEKGLKAKGIKAPADRFAHAVETAMNALGAEGWEYWRADSLPSTERAGLTSSKVVDRHMLVFRRPLAEAAAAELPRRVVQETPAEPQPDPVEEPAARARMPVFTRRLEIAREQREEALQRDETEDEDAPAPRVRPISED